MYVPNPYKNSSITIDETKPVLSADINCDINCIEILPSSIDYEAKPDEAALTEVLRSIKRPENVKALVVDYDSGLKRMPDIKAFTNLEYFHIAGRKIKAYQDTRFLEKLKNVYVAGYKGCDIELAPGVSLEYFRAIRGSLQKIDFSSKEFCLQSCGKLERFGSIFSETMWLEGCHTLELDSLENVKGLNSLRIMGRKKLDSLAFVSKCKSLKTVSITATDMRLVDASVLEESRSLRKLFVGQCSKPLLREFSQSAPSILLSNGDLTLIGGQEKEWSYYESM